MRNPEDRTPVKIILIWRQGPFEGFLDAASPGNVGEWVVESSEFRDE
jgi:hypothetical protein